MAAMPPTLIDLIILKDHDRLKEFAAFVFVFAGQAMARIFALHSASVQKKVADSRFIAQKNVFLWIECRKRKNVN